MGQLDETVKMYLSEQNQHALRGARAYETNKRAYSAGWPVLSACATAAATTATAARLVDDQNDHRSLFLLACAIVADNVVFVQDMSVLRKKSKNVCCELSTRYIALLEIVMVGAPL